MTYFRKIKVVECKEFFLNNPEDRLTFLHSFMCSLSFHFLKLLFISVYLVVSEEQCEDGVSRDEQGVTV